MFQLFDYFSASGIILLSICGLEAFVLSHVYGADRLSDNMEMMLGFKLYKFFKISWKYITPVLTSVSCAKSLVVTLLIGNYIFRL